MENEKESSSYAYTHPLLTPWCLSTEARKRSSSSGDHLRGCTLRQRQTKNKATSIRTTFYRRPMRHTHPTHPTHPPTQNSTHLEPQVRTTQRTTPPPQKKNRLKGRSFLAQRNKTITNRSGLCVIIITNPPHDGRPGGSPVPWNAANNNNNNNNNNNRIDYVS